MLVNISFYIPYGLLINIKNSREEYQKLNNFTESKKEIIIIDTRRAFMGYLYNLDDFHISYKIETKLPAGYDGLLCDNHMFYQVVR